MSHGQGAAVHEWVAIGADPTPGLLVSMCIREDHGFLGATPQPDGSLRDWLTDGERRDRIGRMRGFHTIATSAFGERQADGTVSVPRRPPTAAKRLLGKLVGNEGTGCQLWEEIVGEGFWSAGREARYAAHMPPQATLEEGAGGN